jgi:UDP-3-O-[3-hydroxymyristoyl] glucosamine N-acyltransferase
VVGNFNHISTKSIVNGNCEVGNDSFLGSNAVLAHGVKIADHVIVAAGSNVYKSLKDSGIYLGFPLRKIR